MRCCEVSGWTHIYVSSFPFLSQNMLGRFLHPFVCLCENVVCDGRWNCCLSFGQLQEILSKEEWTQRGCIVCEVNG
jgi:hypothetical protein